MNKIRETLSIIPRTKWGKETFLIKLRGKNNKILDVGCGNNSPYNTKKYVPDCYYVGIDVEDYNNTDRSLSYADQYLLFGPDSFADEIAHLEMEFDAVISNHNIEHCNHPKKVISAICSKLRGGGLLYLAFPSEASANFPHRKGTLNFWDDPTHCFLPVFDNIIQQLKAERMEIIFSTREYRPWYYRIIGKVLEPFSRRHRKIMKGTWAYWGFETVIWARKKD